MSAALVAQVQQLYAAFSRGDVGAIVALLAADVEWGEPDNPFNPAGGTRRGPEGVLEWLKIGHEAEIIEELTPTRFLADATCVAVLGHMRCRARQTQKVYESDFVHLVGFRDGRITKFQEFFDTYAAGEAFRLTSDF